MKKLLFAVLLASAACEQSNDKKIERIEKDYAKNDIALTAINAAKDKNFARCDSLLAILKLFDEKAYNETVLIVNDLKK